MIAVTIVVKEPGRAIRQEVIFADDEDAFAKKMIGRPYWRRVKELTYISSRPPPPPAPLDLELDDVDLTF